MEKITISISRPGPGYDVWLHTPKWYKPEKKIKILNTNSAVALAEVVRYYGLRNSNIGDAHIYNSIMKELKKTKS